MLTSSHKFYYAGQINASIISGRVITRLRGEIPGCITPPADETWLESHGLTPESIAPQYEQAVQDYLRGKIKERDLEHVTSMHNRNGATVSRRKAVHNPGHGMWLEDLAANAAKARNIQRLYEGSHDAAT